MGITMGNACCISYNMVIEIFDLCERNLFSKERIDSQANFLLYEQLDSYQTFYKLIDVKQK